MGSPLLVHAPLLVLKIFEASRRNLDAAYMRHAHVRPDSTVHRRATSTDTNDYKSIKISRPSSGKISRSTTLISLDHSPKIDNNDPELRLNTDRNEPQLDRTSPPPLTHPYLSVPFLSFSPSPHLRLVHHLFPSGNCHLAAVSGRWGQRPRYMSQPIALHSCVSSPAKIKLVIGSTKM